MDVNQQKREALERKALPFFVEFVKFATAFTLIIMFALLTLRVAATAML